MRKVHCRYYIASVLAARNFGLQAGYYIAAMETVEKQALSNLHVSKT